MTIRHLARNVPLTLAVLAAGAAALTASTTEANPRAPADETARVRITVGASTFHATLSTSDTAIAFKALLPVTVTMDELNGNEKHAPLPSDLLRHEAKPGRIRAGDLMLYGSRTLVLFYQSFSSTYRYTRIGTVDDVSGLAAALGPGPATITFE